MQNNPSFPNIAPSLQKQFNPIPNNIPTPQMVNQATQQIVGQVAKQVSGQIGGQVEETINVFGQQFSKKMVYIFGFIIAIAAAYFIYNWYNNKKNSDEHDDEDDELSFENHMFLQNGMHRGMMPPGMMRGNPQQQQHHPNKQPDQPSPNMCPTGNMGDISDFTDKGAGEIQNV